MQYFKGFSKGIVAAVITAVAFIAFIVILVVINHLNSTDYGQYDLYSIIAPDSHNGQIGDHVKGDPNAPVLIFEYADFQCPGCASINPRVNAAIEKSDGQLAVVYRNDILSYHQNGTAAASAAEAAGLQGYWKEYADLLFKNQSDWQYASASNRTALFSQYFTEASDGKGDLDKFKADLASVNISQKISFDIGLSKYIGVTGTPAFYVDGQLIDWSNKNGGSITINGKIIGWETTLTGEQFQDLLLKIVEAKLKSQ